MNPDPIPQILIITGTRGAGKTTLCQRWVDMARASGWQVAGVLSPACLEAGLKTGIDIVDLRSGERRHLADLAPDPAAATWVGMPSGDVPSQDGISQSTASIRTRKWIFDTAALSWGSRILAAAIPCDLLVVDELGPIEFERHEGWVEGLSAVDSKKYHLALVVVRPELLATARQRWDSAVIITVDSHSGTFSS
jgi:nucleoside-triphosphatase